MNDEIVLAGKPNKNKTLVEQLGLADRDKLNPRHDLAVRYAQTKAAKLSEMFKLTPVRMDVEVRLTRPDYRTGGSSGFIIGFADGILWSSDRLDGEEVTREYPSVVEVKITKEPISNCLRQISTYENAAELRMWHRRITPSLLIVDFDITEAEQKMCESKGVRLLRLGKEFDDFVLNQQKTAAKVVEL